MTIGMHDVGRSCVFQGSCTSGESGVKFRRIRTISGHVSQFNPKPFHGVQPLLASADTQSKFQTADEILAQLTVEESVGLVSGQNFWQNSGVPRLGIPPLTMTDGPNGARGPYFDGPFSACVPCGIGLGATWDTDLNAEIGCLLGHETKCKGAHILLAPTINIHRLPITGRHFECFSEDPYLTSCLAVAYIKGVQSVPGVGACAKHFVANDQEDNRYWVSSEVSEHTLRSIYLSPFKAAVQQGSVLSIMTGYNKLNGTWCSEHEWLLKNVLRGEWGFDGLVMSDWFGSHSTAASLSAGLDMEMPYRDWMFYGPTLLRCIRDGTVKEEEVRERALCVLRVMEKLGLLQHDSSQMQPPAASPNTEAQRAVLKRAAEESMVLMKNDGALLPLSPYSKITVVGPNAHQLTIQGGGSPQVLANPISRSVFDNLQQLVHPLIQYELGCDSLSYLPPLSAELCSAPSGQGIADMAIFPGGEWPQGEATGMVPIKTMKGSAFVDGLQHLWNPLFAPSGDAWSARLTTKLVVPRDGLYDIGLGTSGKARLYLDGQLFIQHIVESTDIFDSVLPIKETRKSVNLKAHKAAEITIEWIPDQIRGHLIAGCRLRDWQDDEELIKRAEAAAASSDAVIVIVGGDAVLEREGEDQESMNLPGRIPDLIHRIAARNDRTVVCLNVGSPKCLTPWIDEVKAVLVTWFGGQEAAGALASVLIDGASTWGPCGRLPTTWPRTLTDCPVGVPLGAQYPGESDRVFYGEGAFIGYRWFNSRGTIPLFPFGHGLSYTQFVFRNLHIEPTKQVPVDQDVTVNVVVKNVGTRRGKEVVQVYMAHKSSAGVENTTREMVAFCKVALEPGHSYKVGLLLSASTLRSTFTHKRQGSHFPAELELLVGSSCNCLPLSETLYLV